MTEMTIIEALEKIAELNGYAEILVQTNAGEPQHIENAIEDVKMNAIDEDEVFDLYVTADAIKELDGNGYFDNNEPLYEVLRDITIFDDLSKELKDFIGATSFFSVDEYGIVITDTNERVPLDYVEEQKIYYETGEL